MRWILAFLLCAATAFGSDRPTLGVSARSPGLGISYESLNTSLDTDAVSWRINVALAGGSVSDDVIRAVSDFVVGCKADASPNPGVSNWEAMKSVQLLAGPNSFTGLAEPLKGVAPTFFNFVAGDYDPAMGLLGNGTNKYINSNRNNNSDPQNNKTFGAWCSAAGSGDGRRIGGIGNPTTTGSTDIVGNYSLLTTTSRSNCETYNSASSGGTGFLGTSRFSSSEFRLFNSSQETVIAKSSETPVNGNYFILAANNTGGAAIGFSNARIGFYFAGQAVDLTALDARLSTLMAAITAAHAP